MSKTGGADWQDKLGPQDTVTFEELPQFVLELVPSKDRLVMCYDAEVRSKEGSGAEVVTLKMPKNQKKEITDNCAGSFTVAFCALAQLGMQVLKEQGKTLVVRNRVHKR